MFLDWLKKGLQKPDRSPDGLARRLQVSPSIVNRILSGARQPRVTELDKIAEYIDEPLPQFTKGSPGSPLEALRLAIADVMDDAVGRGLAPNVVAGAVLEVVSRRLVIPAVVKADKAMQAALRQPPANAKH